MSAEFECGTSVVRNGTDKENAALERGDGGGGGSPAARVRKPSDDGNALHLCAETRERAWSDVGERGAVVPAWYGAAALADAERGDVDLRRLIAAHQDATRAVEALAAAGAEAAQEHAFALDRLAGQVRAAEERAERLDAELLAQARLVVDLRAQLRAAAPVNADYERAARQAASERDAAIARADRLQRELAKSSDDDEGNREAARGALRQLVAAGRLEAGAGVLDIEDAICGLLEDLDARAPGVDEAVIECPVKCEGCSITVPMLGAWSDDEGVRLCGRCAADFMAHHAPAVRLVDDIATWQKQTFPPAKIQAVLKHLASEVGEAIAAASEDDAKAMVALSLAADRLFDSGKKPRGAVDVELADIGLLLVAASTAAGVDLLAAMRAKLEQNRTREWRKPDGDGVVEHVDETQATPKQVDIVEAIDRAKTQATPKEKKPTRKDDPCACGAKPGERCVDERGVHLRTMHATRGKAAAEAVTP